MCSYWSEIGPIFSTIKKRKCIWAWILILSYTYEIKHVSPVPFVPPDSSASYLAEYSLKFSCFLFNPILIKWALKCLLNIYGLQSHWNALWFSYYYLLLLLLFYCQKTEAMRGEASWSVMVFPFPFSLSNPPVAFLGFFLFVFFPTFLPHLLVLFSLSPSCLSTIFLHLFFTNNCTEEGLR